MQMTSGSNSEVVPSSREKLFEAFGPPKICRWHERTCIEATSLPLGCRRDRPFYLSPAALTA